VSKGCLRALEFIRAIQVKALDKAAGAVRLPNDETSDIHAFYSQGKESKIGVSPQFIVLWARTY
jgi:hypothetical protein